MRLRAPIALLVLILAEPAAAATSAGAWTTFIRTRDFTDLLATPAEVWCATGEAGLLRYDRGADTLEVLRREPGLLTSNRLSSLAMDRRERLWVGTRGGGVDRRSADGFRWDVVNRFDGLPVDTINVLEAQGDTLWIGTTQGISLWDGDRILGSLPDDGVTVSFDTTFTSSSITGIVVRGDFLWLATRRGVGAARFSTGLSDWRPVNQGLSDLDMGGLASNGTSLFAYSGSTVYLYDDGSGTWQSAGGAGTVHNLVDDYGVVMAAGESGVFTWNGSGWAAVGNSPVAGPGDGDDPEPAVDETGVVFVGAPLGLYRQLGPGSWDVVPPPAGPPGNNLIHVALEGPRVYVTSFDAGVGRYDGAEWRYWPSGPCVGACDSSFINSAFSLGLLVDTFGYKWVGCWDSGVDFFDDSQSPTRFRHFFSRPGGNVSLRQHTWTLSSAVTPDGSRWFGMDTPEKGFIDPIGLDHYDNSDTGRYVRNYNPGNSSMSGLFLRALTVSRDPNGDRLWLGYTEGRGVDFVEYADLPADPDAFEHLVRTDGLDVRGLAVYGDSLWVLTTADLRRFETDATSQSQAVRILAISEGQADLSAKPVGVGPDGTVWAATRGGLRGFHPDGRTDFFTSENSPIGSDDVRGVAVDPSSGVVWMTTSGGLSRYDPFYVPPAAPVSPLQIRVYPNPILTNALGIQLRISGDGESYRGSVYDVTGRRVRDFAASSNGVVIWDGRDQDGHLVKPGIYLVLAESGGRSAGARVVVLR